MMNFNSNTSSSTTPSSFSISNTPQQVPVTGAGISQQSSKINDKSGASQINPPSQQQPIHSGSQNNNHGLGGTIPQQLINMSQQQQQHQSQQNINRNINVTNQQLNKGGNQYVPTNYNYKQFASNTGHKMQSPSNQFPYHQQQQSSSQQQQQILPPSSLASLQHQGVQHLANQKPQTFIQKLQDFSATLTAQHTSMQQQQQMQQQHHHHQQQLQMKMANVNYGQNAPSVAVTSGNQSAASPPSSATAAANQSSMQFSPTKSALAHPQMKKTPTLASPGSQLQKSPPLSQLPAVSITSATLNSQQTSQNKNVPLTVGSNVLTQNITTQQAHPPPPPSSQASQALSISSSSPNKQTVAANAASLSSSLPAATLTSRSNTNSNHSNSTTNSVPSQLIQTENKSDAAAVVTVNAQPQTTTNEPNTQANNNSSNLASGSVSKSNDQMNNKEQSSIHSKSPAKHISEEKKTPQNSLVATENVSKADKALSSSPPLLVSSAAAASGTMPALPVSSNMIPKSSTMRLATVSAPSRKKPPPTITKKVTSTSAQQKSTRSIQPPLVVSKPVENDKTSPKSSENVKTTTESSKPSVSPIASTSKKSQETPSKSSITPLSNVTPKTKRIRTKVQPYQSPTPEITLVTKLSTQTANSSKNGDDKLTIFYKNEFLAVRNGEGTFYLCQAMHNVYKSSPKIRIRWLNEKNEGKVNENGGRVYNLDFYDLTDFECVLTTVDLEKIDGKTFELPKEELTRIESILKKAIDVERGVVPRPDVTEENPDGLDLSLYKDESQLDKISSTRKRKNKKGDTEDDSESDDEEPVKKKSASKSSVQVAKKILTPRTSAKKPIVEAPSSESDEENLMEIKKKAKNQQSTNLTQKTTSEKIAPQASTSASKDQKSPANAGARGRKRSSTTTPSITAIEKSAKVIKVDKTVEEKKLPITPTKINAEIKTSPKGKVVAIKKIATVEPEKKEENEEKKVVKEKKATVEKKQSPLKKKPEEKPAVISATNSPNKKKIVAKEKSVVTPVESAQSSNVSAPATAKTKASPTKARNTRSKK